MMNRVRDYELIESLGKGGMGEVFKARNVIIKEDVVAIKIIRPDLLDHPEMRHRFLREATVLLKLDHRNIMKYRHMFEEQGQLYLVMEYIEGVRLDRELKREKLVSFQEGVGLLRQIVSGVSYAHRKGVLHRDLKPENIVIMKDGTIKIYDFGLAKELGRGSGGVTASTQILGTPPYLPPEVVKSEVAIKDVGPEGDIYAMGVIAYRIFSGRLPYGVDEDESSLKLLSKLIRVHLEGTPLEPLSKFRDDLPPDFSSSIMAALERKPSLRPNDASAWLKFPDDRSFDRPLGAPFGRISIPEINRLSGVKPAASPRVEQADLAPPSPPALEEAPAVKVDTAPGKGTDAPVPYTLDIAAEDLAVTLQPAKSPDAPVPHTLDIPAENVAVAPQPHADVPVPTATVNVDIRPPMDAVPSGEDEFLDPSIERDVMREYDVYYKRFKWLIAGLGGAALLIGLLFLAASFSGSGPKPAAISVITSPADSTVFLDGKVVSIKSPYTQGDLPPGDHRLEVKQGGYVTHAETIRVAPGETATRTVSLKKELVLEPALPNTPEPVATVEEPPSPERKKTQPVKARKGYLSVGTNVRGRVQVLVDSKPVGFTPLRKHPLPSGQHTVVLVAPDGRSKSRKVNIKVDEITNEAIFFD